MLNHIIKCECGNKKVVDPRNIPLEYILQHKWCPNCRRRGCWRVYLAMMQDGIVKF